jgi:hypothetical protein
MPIPANSYSAAGDQVYAIEPSHPGQCIAQALSLRVAVRESGNGPRAEGHTALRKSAPGDKPDLHQLAANANFAPGKPERDYPASATAENRRKA